MFWNKKEDKKSLPDLPPLQSPFSKDLIPQMNTEEHTEEHAQDQSLPSFPDSPLNRGFSQSVIKDAVGSSEEEEPIGQPFNDKTFKTIEMDDDSHENDSLPPLPQSRSLSSLSFAKEEKNSNEDEEVLTK